METLTNVRCGHWLNHVRPKRQAIEKGLWWEPEVRGRWQQMHALGWNFRRLVQNDWFVCNIHISIDYRKAAHHRKLKHPQSRGVRPGKHSRRLTPSVYSSLPLTNFGVSLAQNFKGDRGVTNPGKGRCRKNKTDLAGWSGVKKISARDTSCRKLIPFQPSPSAAAMIDSMKESPHRKIKICI